MRTRTRFSLTTAVPALVITIAASILCAAAQDVVVKVPFEFQAGGAHFAPGEYVLSMDKLLTGSVMIQSTDRSHRAVLLTSKSISAAVPASAPVVSFRGYGESRFLSAVQGESASQRWEIVPTADEAAVARNAERPMVESLQAANSGTK